MGEKSYKAAPYKMRNEAAWMVCEDPSERVVVLTLPEKHAATLADLLNVATLATPVTDYEQGRAPRRMRPVAHRQGVRKPAEEG